MIEFAIVLPLLIIFVFGIIEFGLIIYDKAMITNASREGARVGIIFRVDSNGDYISPDEVQGLIEGRVREYLSTYLINFGPHNLTIDIPPVTGTSPGGILTVTVNYDYRFLVIPSFIRSITPTIQLSAATTMRLE